MPVANKLFPVDAAGIGGSHRGAGICSYLGRSTSSGVEVTASAADRGHSNHWERAVRATEVSQSDEGLNVKFVPNAIGRFTDSESASPMIGGTGKVK